MTSLIDLEIMLVGTFGWSLFDIDRTDIASLLGFVRRMTAAKASPPRRRAYIDQVQGFGLGYE